jgi:hypothetical protein
MEGKPDRYTLRKTTGIVKLRHIPGRITCGVERTMFRVLSMLQLTVHGKGIAPINGIPLNLELFGGLPRQKPGDLHLQKKKTA